MEKKYIKMNNNRDFLSLGNLFNIIKKYSKVSSSAMQVELFYSIFNVSNVSKTTINNYLIGYRPISLEYKRIYFNLKEKYNKDKFVFIDIILKVLTILDECIYIRNDNSLDIINNSDSLKLVCRDLISLSKEDKNINEYFVRRIENCSLYECFIEVLFYCILENNQPIYIQKINDSFRNSDLDEYLKVDLYDGISYISSLMELSDKNNMYANAMLGSLEYSGVISGKVNYENSFKYYLLAAKKDHPKACFMVANLIINKRVDYDFEIMWEYLNKAIKLGSIAALNTMGNCYKNGTNQDMKVDIDKAIKYYISASDYGYPYAYNNLGLIYEERREYDDALKYFKLSADLNNSWALNKVGEILRKKGDLNNAYYYYVKSIECPKVERNYYGYYNLAKYYYLVGNDELGIEKDEETAKEYFDIFYENVK